MPCISQIIFSFVSELCKNSFILHAAFCYLICPLNVLFLHLIRNITCSCSSAIFTAVKYSIPECNHFPVDGQEPLSNFHGLGFVCFFAVMKMQWTFFGVSLGFQVQAFLQGPWLGVELLGCRICTWIARQFQSSWATWLLFSFMSFNIQKAVCVFYKQ